MPCDTVTMKVGKDRRRCFGPQPQFHDFVDGDWDKLGKIEIHRDLNHDCIDVREYTKAPIMGLEPADAWGFVQVFCIRQFIPQHFNPLKIKLGIKCRGIKSLVTMVTMVTYLSHVSGGS